MRHHESAVDWETAGVRGEVVPLHKFVEASRKLDTRGIDWARVREHPLDAQALEALTYMADVEGYTRSYLRDLLNTSAIDDPDVSRFMTLWAYEELFHQEALQRFLAEYGVTFDRERGKRLRQRRSWRDFLLTTVGASAVSFLTTDFLAVYMTWGAINELSTALCYDLLAERAQHPILADLLRRIVKDERRHFAFYHQQARARLERPVARWLTARLVRACWRPVGSGVKTPGEMRDAIGYCFDGAAGRRAARELDRRVAELPGLGWFRLAEAYVDELDRAGRQPAGVAPPGAAAAPGAGARAHAGG